jgi:hypothetical protein
MLLPLLLLAACDGEKPATDTAPAACDPAVADAEGARPIVPGAPMAGAAEAILQLPIGTPLSGYTSRCGCFGGDGKADRRDSAYTARFAPSAGLQTPIPLKAVWLSNGDQDLVVLKLDLIYSFDGLTREIEQRLSAATGRDMAGKVVVATNHSHNAYGDFSDAVQFYLGSDRFNYEIFTRVAEQAEAVALTALDGMVPARIGVGYAKDWDPDDRVYRDRRPDNDDLAFFPDIPAGRYKDPNLTMMRVDTLEGAPLAVLFNFGIHGTALGADNTMVSVDAPGHVETVFQERFDTPVVVALLQGGAGDASPAGEDDFYANMETVGENAADALESLWSRIPTSSEPIRLETATRAVAETHQDIRVTRGGTVDLRYVPYDEDLVPDEVVYNPDGSLAAPIDEFNVPYGAAFCGEDPPYLPGFAPSQSFPYNQCVEISKLLNVIGGFFELAPEEKVLPIFNSTTATVTASRVGPLPILEADGTTSTDDFFMGFFPGETTAMFTEQFRRRASTELGYRHSMAVGYAQDHEGYLLIPEDWLQGGYEADINVWGPLQAEHLMEQLLVMADDHLATDVVEANDACGAFQPPDYAAKGGWTLPTLAPDLTPEAGTALTEAPTYLYSPLYSDDERQAGVVPGIAPADTVPRVQGLVEFAWAGGDPGVDFPVVTLQRLEGREWVTVRTEAGRPVALGPDILLTHTPNPLNPSETLQAHTWYAAWQAVGHVADRAGLPLGLYRLHVEGESYAGGSTTYPWAKEPYTVDSPTFEVTAATVSLDVSGGDLRAWLQAPARGYRMVAQGGAVRGQNPLEGDTLTVTRTLADGSSATETVVGRRDGRATLAAGVVTDDVVALSVTDAWGNVGSWTRAE